MKPLYFKSPAAFHDWLAKHHDSEVELWVGFHRKKTKRPTLTWPESVEVALAFGWIDGIRKSVDDERYVIRFTPRRTGSSWSNVNVRTAERLIRDGTMHPAGRRAFEARKHEKTGIYSFENRDAAKLDEEAEAEFRRNQKAWTFFESQPAGYRKTAIWLVVSAKRPETRAKRLEALIRDSEAGVRIKELRRE
jgi:uncharacterized protein YdeI (YjbR/CyaY-like superfamily)